jgi:hypothetical protein
MRTLWLLLLAGLLAWGTWLLLFQDEDPAVLTDPYTEETQRPEAPRAQGAQPGPTTGTLAVRVRTAAGHIPAQAKAGYRHRGELRLKALDARGGVLFTDAPLGDLIVVAAAPGYLESTQPRYLTSGIRTDVILTLKTGASPEK